MGSNKHQSNIVSICGGLVDKLYYVHSNEKSFVEEKSNDEKPYCVALLITGPIQIWSAILDNTLDKIKDIERELRSFRERVILQEHSVGFMFTCEDRIRYLKHDARLEFKLFKKFVT